MVRVLRPGGRLCLIDTDWRSLTTDLADTEAQEAALAERFIAQAYAAGRQRRFCMTLTMVAVGGRLP